MTRRQRYRALVSPHVDSLYRYARTLEREPSRAEDLLQQALLVGLERLDQLRSDDAARVWLARIVYRTFVNLRAARTEETLDPAQLDNVVSLPTRHPEAELANRQLGRALSEALDSLPDVQRDALWLVDGQGFTYAEAASILDLAPGTVASRVARGRLALRASLQTVARDEGVIR